MWSNSVEQYGKTVELCGGTVEQCGTMWWNIGTVWNIVEQYCGTVWNGKVEEWKCGAGNSGTVR